MLHNKRAFQLSINMIVVIILGLTLMGVGFSIFFSAYNQTVDLKENVDSQTQRQLNDLLDSGEAIVIPINSKDVERGDYIDFDLGVSNELTSSSANSGRMDDFFLYIRFDRYVGRYEPRDSSDEYQIENILNANPITRPSCIYTYAAATKIPRRCADSWLLISKENAGSTGRYETDIFSLEVNERHSVPLRFVMPKRICSDIDCSDLMGLPEGQYIFNVDVLYEPQDRTDCDYTIRNTCYNQYFSKKKIYIKVN